MQFGGIILCKEIGLVFIETYVLAIYEYFSHILSTAVCILLFTHAPALVAALQKDLTFTPHSR